jgi:hypothetical protein
MRREAEGNTGMTKLIGIEEHFVTADIRAAWQHLQLDRRALAGSIGVRSRSGSTTWAKGESR